MSAQEQELEKVITEQLEGLLQRGGSIAHDILARRSYRATVTRGLFRVSLLVPEHLLASLENTSTPRTTPSSSTQPSSGLKQPRVTGRSFGSISGPIPKWDSNGRYQRDHTSYDSSTVTKVGMQDFYDPRTRERIFQIEFRYGLFRHDDWGSFASHMVDYVTHEMEECWPFLKATRLEAGDPTVNKEQVSCLYCSEMIILTTRIYARIGNFPIEVSYSHLGRTGNRSITKSQSLFGDINFILNHHTQLWHIDANIALRETDRLDALAEEITGRRRWAIKNTLADTAHSL